MLANYLTKEADNIVKLTHTNEGHEDAGKSNSKKIDIGIMNLSMNQDIVQKVAAEHSFKEKKIH